MLIRFFFFVSLFISEFSFAQNVKPGKSTASPNVQIIDTAFYMPQLKRTRRIWIYLPSGYETSKKKDPVLYLQDGQNVFDNATSFAGEWGVDEFLDSFKSVKCIVVAIDNGAEKRLNEYCPYDFSFEKNKIDKGEGKQYAEFLVKTLKPFIDKKYRTLKDRKNTFIAGSSLGGLISMYTIVKYPKVFGGAGIFSPAFWIAPKIFEEIHTKGKKVNAKIFFYAGKDESETMVPLMINAFNDMHKVSSSKMELILRTDGKHNEASWRMEFPGFYEWIKPQLP